MSYCCVLILAERRLEVSGREQHCRRTAASLVRTTCADGSRQCFGTHDDEKFLDAGLEQTWRLWLFQGG
jgi:hypothetical protein